MDIRIYIRHLQLFNIAGDPIVYTGTTPQTINATSGYVPQRDWIDISTDVGDRDKLRIIFTMDRDLNGVSQAGAFQPKKSTTGALLIEGDAYRFIKAWCIDHVSAPMNYIDVKIVDTSCGEYLGFSIKSNQIRWCENGICEFDVTLKQTDPDLQCIQRTLISDNWQGMFQIVPANGKKHPRFGYCNEERPNGKLIFIWYIRVVLFASSGFMIIMMATAINPILFILNLIQDALIGAFGIGRNWNIPDPVTVKDINDALEQSFIESGGCGREHPAPLIRDYIKNVCDKCKIQVDEITAPVFFAKNISLKASTRDLNNVPNPHYNACYMTPSLQRGIRRHKNLNLIFGYQGLNTTDFYIPDNAPIETLSDFLDKVKEVYNHEWRITNGKLYFWRKDWFTDGPPVYDFTSDADKAKILEGVCFEWNEIKYPASVTGLYSMDPSDTCGNEAMSQMNGVATFGYTEANPLFEGILDKTSNNFSGTKFRMDGASEDYIYDALQVVANGSIFTTGSLLIVNPFIAVAMNDILSNTAGAFNDIAGYSLMLRDETCVLGKIIIWDGKDYLNAKAVRNIVPINNDLAPSDPTPQINTKYNSLTTSLTPVYEAWHQRHEVHSYVRGRNLTTGGTPMSGEYVLKNYFNGVLGQQPARLVNYPMYFEPGYLDTLWDWFHWIDDPRANPKLNMNWRVKIELCCEDLNRLKVLGKAEDIQLGHKVIVPTKYYKEGVLKEIVITYDSTDKLGKNIELKGSV